MSVTTLFYLKIYKNLDKFNFMMMMMTMMTMLMLMMMMLGILVLGWTCISLAKLGYTLNNFAGMA